MKATHMILLVRIAGLGLALDNEMKRNPDFEVNWSTVKDWLEASRYEKHGEKEAQNLYFAVTNGKHGVLQWIRQYW